MAYGIPIIVLVGCCTFGQGSPGEGRLLEYLSSLPDLLATIKPQSNRTGGTTDIHLGLRLIDIEDMDHVDQVLSIRMTFSQEWHDPRLAWHPSHYGGVTQVKVPYEDIWTPDFIVYNSGDSTYNDMKRGKATLYHTGRVVWDWPHAIFKVPCAMNIKYFPFDEHHCKVVFGSWTYDGYQIDIFHKWQNKLGLKQTDFIEEAVDLSGYDRHMEWDLIQTSAQVNMMWYACCSEPYLTMAFYISLRRKPLFYVVNLIIPCVAVNMMSWVTFILPCDSGEKVSFSVTVLTSLTIFQMFLMDLIPVTSIVVPLVSRYLLLNYFLTACSVMVTVICLNLSSRSDTTSKMPSIIRTIFIRILPRVFLMGGPERRSSEDPTQNRGTTQTQQTDGEPHSAGLSPRLDDYKSGVQTHLPRVDGRGDLPNTDHDIPCEACARQRVKTHRSYVKQLSQGIHTISEHIRQGKESTKTNQEWKRVALVIDRLLLLIYLMVCVGTTLELTLRI